MLEYYFNVKLAAKILFIPIIFIFSLNSAIGGLELNLKPIGEVDGSGVLYAFDNVISKPLYDINGPDLYNYTYEIKIAENLSNISLQIYDNETKNWLIVVSNSTKPLTDACQSDNNTTEIKANTFSQNATSYLLTYKIDLSKIFKQPFLGKSKYRLSDSSGHVLGDWEWYGPDIKVNIRNEKSIENGTNGYDYYAEVRESQDVVAKESLPIYIYYKNKNSTAYCRYDKPQIYDRKDGNWTTLVWKNAPPFWRLEFGIDKSDIDCHSKWVTPIIYVNCSMGYLLQSR
jgi:hypothetical protein